MKKLLFLALSVVLFSCSSDSDSDGGGSGGAGVAYIKGKMDGTAFDYTFNNTVDDSYLYNATAGFSGEGSSRWYYYGGVMTTFNPPVFAPEFYISWNNMYFSASGDEAAETSAFYDSVSDLTSHYLTQAEDDAHMAGLDLEWRDASDVSYSSKAGSQSGSTFNVTGSSQETIMGQQTKTVWGTFSCKLYNVADLTDVINVTNGSFKIILSEYN